MQKVNLRTWLKDNFTGSSSNTIMTALNGKNVEIIGNSNNHTYGKIGDRFKINIEECFFTSTAPFNFTVTTISHLLPSNPSSLATSDLALITTPITIEEFREEVKRELDGIVKSQERIQQLNSDIELMEKLNLSEYDYQVIRAYEILETIDDESSNIIKAKKIALLFKK